MAKTNIGIHQIDEVDLTLVRDFYLVGDRKIKSSKEAVDIFRQFWDENLINIQEQMSVMLLDRANKVIGMYQHSKGSITGTVADVELITAVAIKSLAKGVIIAHNHPSGNLNPSAADIDLSKKLKAGLTLFDIQLLDSLILVPDKSAYYSFTDEGKLEKGGSINDAALHFGREEENDYGTFELYKKGGEVKVNIINAEESYDADKYNWLLNDFDGDGVINADDHNPLSKTDAKQIDTPSLSVGVNYLLNLKQTMDANMYSFVNDMKEIAPDGSTIYARTKTPYSILNKLITKRLMNPKTGLTDLIGTTIVTDDKKELDKVKDVINSGALGRVVEFEDMYASPKAGYRAYHFLVDRNGMTIEVQLKTKRQKALNELSHEPYKLGKLDGDKLLKMSRIADEADNGDKEAIKEYNQFMQQPNLEKAFYMRMGGSLALGGQTDVLVEEDFVWNAMGKKMQVDRVTDNEYYLSSFGMAFPVPFNKKKVDGYIRSGVWSLKPKYVGGGLTEDSIHIIRERLTGKHIRKFILGETQKESVGKVLDAKVSKTDAGDMRIIIHLDNGNTETVPVSKWPELLNGRAVAMGSAQSPYVIQLKDVMEHGGGVGAKYQIRNSSGEYFSVDMDTRMPVWNRGVDSGYSYPYDQAQKVKEQLENMGYQYVEVVPYEPHKSVMDVRSGHGQSFASGGYNQEGEAAFMEEKEELYSVLNRNYEDFVKLLGENIKDDKFREAVKYLAKKVGAVDYKIIDVPCHRLRPTQNEISLQKSLSFPLTSTYFADLYLSAKEPIRIKGNTIVTCDEGRYIIDGHHRWSQVYLMNPDALMACTDFYELKDPIEALKATQLGIAADLGYVPTASAKESNLLTISESDLKNYVSATITEEVREVMRQHGIYDAEEYIWGNVQSLKDNNQPIRGASDRDYMPQTDLAPQYAEYTPKKVDISMMGGGNVDKYERKREWAARRMAENALNENLTQEQHEALAELAAARHNLHISIDRLIQGEDWSAERRLIKANIAIEESGLKPMDFIPTDESDFIDIDNLRLATEIDEVPDEDDEEEYNDWYVDFVHRVSGEWEDINTKIENYLREIDKKYGTNYAPSGMSRYEGGGMVNKDGMIYALTHYISNGTIAANTDAIAYGDLDEIRSNAIAYYRKNGDVPYSFGELLRVLKLVSSGSTMASGGYMAKGGQIGKFRVTPVKNYDGHSNLVTPDYSLSFVVEGTVAEANQEAQNFVRNNENITSAYVTKLHPSGHPLKNKKVSDVTKDEIIKYEGGGDVEYDGEGVDLFETPENIPPKVQQVLDRYFVDGDEDYETVQEALDAVEKIGYTFDYGLDGTPYDLRKIGQVGKSRTYKNGGQLELYKLFWRPIMEADGEVNSTQTFAFAKGGEVKKLTASQVKIIKQVFDKDPSKRFRAIQGNIDTLMELSYMIGEKDNYFIVLKNLEQVISFKK